jgi:hypothetical protein
MFKGRMMGISALGLMAGLAAIAPAMGVKAVEAPSQRETVRPIPRRRVRPYRPLNRSRHWPAAESYLHARQISPYPDRPVR